VEIYGSTSKLFEILRFFRLLRVFRLLKLIRFSPTLKVALKSLKSSYEGFLLLIQIILVNLVFFSTIMYFVEGYYCYFDQTDSLWKYINNNATSQFQSILGTFWWNIVSVTTVGYGDVVPLTPWGRFVASVALISGIILLSFPIAIFGTNFHFKFSKVKSRLEGRNDAEIGDVDKKLKALNLKMKELETKLDLLLEKIK